MQSNFPRRRRPTHGVLPDISDKPVIIFVTVCTKERHPWLACERVHQALIDVWQHADSWKVGQYVLMPDHLHLFAGWTGRDIGLEKWVSYWKSRFSQLTGEPTWRWQTDCWDRRLRHDESYQEK